MNNDTLNESNTYHFIQSQVPHLLLTRPSKEAGATLGKKQERKRKLSGGDELLKGFLSIHEACEQLGPIATPRRYMAFVHAYQEVYQKKKSKIEERQNHLKVSMQRL